MHRCVVIVNEHETVTGGEIAVNISRPYDVRHPVTDLTADVDLLKDGEPARPVPRHGGGQHGRRRLTTAAAASTVLVPSTPALDEMVGRRFTEEPAEVAGVGVLDDGAVGPRAETDADQSEDVGVAIEVGEGRQGTEEFAFHFRVVLDVQYFDGNDRVGRGRHG